jgi:HNH endonuclease
MFLDSSNGMEYSGIDTHHTYQEIAMAEKIKFRVVTELDYLKARLFNKCRLVDSGCWEWISANDGHYGLIYCNNKNNKAHRVSYEAFVGPIPKGLHILHSCDNPLCINPAHLRPGTAKENMADRDRRGRRDVRGEQIGTSKLTADDVIEIRKSTLGLKELGEKYGVDPSNIWAIRTGKSWKHVPLRSLNGH